ICSAVAAVASGTPVVTTSCGATGLGSETDADGVGEGTGSNGAGSGIAVAPSARPRSSTTSIHSTAGSWTGGVVHSHVSAIGKMSPLTAESGPGPVTTSTLMPVGAHESATLVGSSNVSASRPDTMTESSSSAPIRLTSISGLETPVTLQTPFGPVRPSCASSTVVGGTGSPNVGFTTFTVAPSPRTSTASVPNSSGGHPNTLTVSSCAVPTGSVRRG